MTALSEWVGRETKNRLSTAFWSAPRPGNSIFKPSSGSKSNLLLKFAVSPIA